MSAETRLTLDSAATYEIRVQGYLDERWNDAISGIGIQVQRQPGASSITVITGEFQDQAALSGTLSFLFDLGLPLLSVNCLGFDSAP